MECLVDILYLSKAFFSTHLLGSGNILKDADVLGMVGAAQGSKPGLRPETHQRKRDCGPKDFSFLFLLINGTSVPIYLSCQQEGVQNPCSFSVPYFPVCLLELTWNYIKWRKPFCPQCMQLEENEKEKKTIHFYLFLHMGFL